MHARRRRWLRQRAKDKRLAAEAAAVVVVEKTPVAPKPIVAEDAVVETVVETVVEEPVPVKAVKTVAVKPRRRVRKKKTEKTD